MLPLYKLETSNTVITPSNIKLTTSDNYNLPLLKLGFVKDIYENKDIFGKLINKVGIKKSHTKNLYEHKISGYNKSMGIIVDDYFSLTKNKEPGILSRAFFKMWEMLLIYKLVPKTSNFVSAHLAEGPGSFIQATLLYRKNIDPVNSANDKYYGITIHSENKNIPEINKTFMKYYEKNYKHHKTFLNPKNNEDSGDLTKAVTINNFIKHFEKNKAMLVTADGGFVWKNENLQEQEATKLILCEVLTALLIQANNGNFICKIFESFTETTVKIIMLCQYFYEEVHIIKPYTSRQTNSEKYIVCLKFKGINDDFRKKILGLHASIEKVSNINDFLDVKMPTKLTNQISLINSHIANLQYEVISNSITCIHNNNTDEYEQDIKNQISANNKWIEIFFPKNRNFNIKIK